MNGGLLVCASMFYPHDQVQSRADCLIDSASRHDIELGRYGEGSEAFPGWIPIKVTLLTKFIEENVDGHEHVLYTDTMDAFFLSGVGEIMRKFRDLQSPMVMSAERECYPARQGDDFPLAKTPYRYLNAGQFMGRTEHVLEMLRRITSYQYLGGNDQAWWQQAFIDKKVDMVIDHECSIFQTFSGGAGDDLEAHNGVVWNRVTGYFPCMMHFNGQSGNMRDFYRSMHAS